MTSVQLVVVPYDGGRRGWRMGAGPERILSTGLASRLEAHGHSVDPSLIALPDDGTSGEIAVAFGLMRLLAQSVHAALEAGRFPLVLSGNCNTACGTLAGLAPLSRAVFWFDAHGDCNTPETTATGYLDGMALATAMGWCWRPMAASIPGFWAVDEKAVVILGARDIDAAEADLLSHSAVAMLPPTKVREAQVGDALRALPPVDAAYLHCDLDVLDPSEGQASPYRVAEGLSVAQVIRAIAAIGRAVPIKAAALTAYAPEYDDGRIAEAAVRIAEAIVAAAASGDGRPPPLEA